MRFYRVSTWKDGDASDSAGFTWHTSRRAAEAEASEHRDTSYNAAEASMRDVRVVDIEPTKQGILDALKVYASHPDNG
jgi:hypothetical protein